ncbi:MAG TPA: hypothetical protein VHZ96_26460 [Frankiaceae bacterium]|jgi:hypothetical protein|nr:hypothetical protein [Frankiaceae bacterium]
MTGLYGNPIRIAVQGASDDGVSPVRILLRRKSTGRVIWAVNVGLWVGLVIMDPGNVLSWIVLLGCLISLGLSSPTT